MKYSYRSIKLGIKILPVIALWSPVRQWLNTEPVKPNCLGYLKLGSRGVCQNVFSRFQSVEHDITPVLCVTSNQKVVNV